MNKDNPIGLITYVIRNFYPTCKVEEDELLSIGYIGYSKAMKRFDVTKAGNTEFGYIASYVRNEITTYLRKYHNDQPSSLNNDLAYESVYGNAYDLADTTSIDDEVEVQQMKDCIQYLNKQEQEVITRMYYTQIDASMQEVGNDMGLSRERIRQVHDIAINKLRRLTHWEYKGDNHDR